MRRFGTMRGTAACAILALFCACSKPPSGAAAPGLKLDVLLQAPRSKLAGWSELKGKVVVLEFWATWCDPCVEEIPHLNRLVDAFAGKPIVFISISDEPKDKIEAFLRDHPIKGWIAADAKLMFSAFGVRGRPATIIVDANGNLAGRTYPGFLRPEDLEGVLAGKPLAKSAAADAIPDELERPASGDVLFEARLSSATGTKMSFSSGEDSFTGRGLSAQTLLAQAFGVNESRVKLETELSGYYDVDVRVPAGAVAKLPASFQNAALAGLGLSYRWESRKIEATVLLRSAGSARLKPAPKQNGRRGFSTGPGRITASGMSLPELADSLEQWLGRPVIDETGLSGRYDFELTWDPAKTETLPLALESQLGLRAAKARRPVRLLVFKSEPGP